ncbi:hypothetical protein TI39_contig598g00028 [Zymoseptoria brevis]|uniref:AB hydrolase-1 domain-containing protein n=1 Tax=Zymoseptoria brevis TaxID=1047168 RepID=A0A0F4GH85_9PEZI|nr:hypothetical protein TI39_contig598g00028 [Zymoseptoria brevis]
MAEERGRKAEGSRNPPPLPQRQSHTEVETPPPYKSIMHQQKAYEKASSFPEPNAAGLMHNDPRSSSQQSLVPEPGSQSERRKLLCVFVHGFMGNETSFRSFPAHVHSLLTVLLAETHVVHTKVYPRYRSRGNITVARDSFSKWIEPHQDSMTDVVLLGHSMGGLLCAEIVLMRPPSPGSRPLNHRILGTINFDVPFLGMHPGIVKSGLASLFKPADEPRDVLAEAANSADSAEEGSSQDPAAISSPPPRPDTFWSKGQMDPNYNTPYPNDVKLAERKGWRNAWHFVSKHSDNLTGATKKLISSHLEFGGAMANYGELKTRYARIRALEEQDSRIRQSVVEGGVPPRVRFINYYTASTGRPKKPASPNRKSPSPGRSRQSSTAASDQRPASTHRERESRSLSTSSVNERPSRQSLSPSPLRSATSMRDLSPRPEMLSISPRPEPQQEECDSAMESLSIGEPSGGTATLSELPELPEPPKPLDLSFIEDPDTRRAVEKEHAKAVKIYEKTAKERSKLIEDRKKAQDKHARKEQKAAVKAEKEETKHRTKSDHKLTHSEKEALRLEAEKQRMEAEARRMRGEPEPESEPARIDSLPRSSVDSSRRPSMSTSAVTSTTTIPTISRITTGDTENLSKTESKEKPKGPPKDRKFCSLPPKDSNGERDPCWVRVFMKDMDEVGAHCGLFFVDERYERLVGDVAERIEGWVKEDVDRRMLEDMKE